MPNYRRAGINGGTYFFTVVAYRRQTFLCDEPVRIALRRAIDDVRKTHPFCIDGWVLLPDHLHCMWTLPPGDPDFSVRWAMIKRAVTKQCKSILHSDDWMSASKIKRNESTIWQRRFWEHRIRNDRDYEHHLNYIHYNPVKHNHVQSAMEWPWSTFHRYVQQGIYDAGWGEAMKNETLHCGEPTR